MKELLAAGGMRRALEWVVEGMSAQSAQEMSARPTRATFIAKLQAMDISIAMAEKMAAQAAEAGELELDGGASPTDALDDDHLPEAEYQAMEIAMALSESRVSTRDLSGGIFAPSLDRRYRESYPIALGDAGVAGADLVERFPVLNVMYGYTRGGGAAGETRIVPFRNPKGGYRLYGDLSDTEAIFFRLDPLRIVKWLRDQGHQLPGLSGKEASPPAARLAILAAADVPLPGDAPSTRTIGSDVFRLIHTFAHRLLRQMAVFAGIDRDALCEYLVPLHLGFFVYAAPRGDFVLGGLQALFETELDALLRTFLTGERRCPLDPGCSRGGGACSACLHIGEPSCRGFNTMLSRSALFGPSGYLQ